MAIGTIKGLADAAQGRVAPRSVVIPVEPSRGLNLTSQIQRRETLGQSAASALAQQAAGKGPGIPTEATSVYSNLLNQTTRATGGLTEKGKYGGFLNAGDLETAIKGAAISFGRTSTPATLRAKAEAFYNKLDPIYGEAAKSPSRALFTRGMSQLPSVDPRRQYSSEGYVGKIVNPTRQYAKTLDEWYKQQSIPAETYMQTAQQLEATPLSSLATQIATSAYGMNPDLAAGKFGDLDTAYYKQQRDAQSLAQYGMPYEQWKDQQAALAKEQKAIPSQWSAALESATGYKSSAMSGLTAQTPEQMYTTFGQQYTYVDPETNKEVVSNGKAIVDIMRNYLTTGQSDLALQLADSFGQQDIARILNAMYNLGSTKDIRTKQFNTLYSGR